MTERRPAPDRRSSTTADSSPVASIRIEDVEPEVLARWRTLVKVANALGENETWCLVGGLMVSLFAMEAGKLPRPTADIDILGDARRRPSGTRWVTRHLQSLGGELHEFGGFEAKVGFRVVVDGHVIDVLAPDGLAQARPPMTTGRLHTLQIPGGTQALQRTEVVEIDAEGEAATLRRPTLIAAILLKARALPVHRRQADQREDLVTLLGLLTDPRVARLELRKTEIGWLRAIEEQLRLSDDDLADLHDEAHLRVARAAYRILIA